MSDIAVKVENLGKEYRIGGKQEAYGTLRDTLTDAFMGPIRRARSLIRGEAYGAAELDQTIWALKDVSFEVKHGDVIGIIGHNGAGKSTLLKILSRITEPSRGRVVLNGRVGALLEVGTGFHQELTGRENIYLNGAILGMTQEEINRRFDEIVDFSGIEKFIDTPLKHYSSGMNLRLGFAVASHLEPEILVVDEVLAVGDLEFQKKCLGKMSDVATQGRTVLFVSHNLGAIQQLCTRAVCLKKGYVEEIGEVHTVVNNYEVAMNQQMPQTDAIHNAEWNLRLHSIGCRVVDESDHAHLLIELDLESQNELNQLGISVTVIAQNGWTVAKLGYSTTGIVIETLEGANKCILRVANVEQYLAAGGYSINVAINSAETREIILHIPSAGQFFVPSYDIFGTGANFNMQKGIVPLRLTLADIVPSSEVKSIV